VKRIAALCFCILSACHVASAQDVPAANTRPEINLRQTVTVDVVRKTKDAVVYISTTKLIAQPLFGNDPFFGQFDMGIVNVPANSLGSGFVIHEDGYVVTNNHVIERARQITVEFDDGRKLPAQLVSSDADADLAILKVESDTPLPRLELGDSADLLIGEPVIAVGNPLGFSHSVSTGIVSAMHRELKDPRGNVMLRDLIQTDAAINPGNSGGPLLNAYGQVIGINTAIRGDAQNIGFAIQVNTLRDLIPELLNPAQVTKVEVTIKLRETRKSTPPATVTSTVSRADKNAPIATIAGKRPRDIVDAYAILLRQKVGEPFEIALATGGGAAERITPIEVPTPDVIVQARKRLGITVEAMTPVLAERYGMAAETGVIITEVMRDGVGARAGFEPGDVIVRLGRYQVGGMDDFATLMQHLPATGRVRVTVLRGDRVGTGILELR
jgi:serine protease Do